MFSNSVCRRPRVLSSIAVAKLPLQLPARALVGQDGLPSIEEHLLGDFEKLGLRLPVRLEPRDLRLLILLRLGVPDGFVQLVQVPGEKTRALRVNPGAASP
jgi:hypothetical protein